MDNLLSIVQLVAVHSIKVAPALRSVTTRQRQSAKLMMHGGHRQKRPPVTFDGSFVRTYSTCLFHPLSDRFSHIDGVFINSLRNTASDIW